MESLIHKVTAVITCIQEKRKHAGALLSVGCKGHHDSMTYHSEGDNGDQVLLADEDLGHSDVCGPLPGVLHLPRDGLCPREAAETGDFKIHLHDLIE